MNYQYEKDAFLAYTDRFDTANGMIDLKIQHTLRVVEVMDRITESKHLPEKMRYLSAVCALFHDIGRFEQVRRYGTLNDRISTDHAALSCEIIKAERFLDHLSDRERTMILTAVACHNRLSIDDGLDEEMLLLSKLIRDADKVDIFRVFATEEMVDTMGETIEQVARETVTDEVFECFMSHRCIPRSMRRTGLDIWVGYLGFFYDMNFPESFKIAMEESYYMRPFRMAEFTQEETRQRVNVMLREIELYINKRCVTGQASVRCSVSCV